MAVRIRFKRLGRRNRPFFRLVAADIRAPRDGKTLDILGFWDPLVEDETKAFVVHEERLRAWVGKGARISEAVRPYLKRRGLLPAPSDRERKRRASRRRGARASARPAASPKGA